jgi:ABC-type glycerol-3-phosphate transport system permease component
MTKRNRLLAQLALNLLVAVFGIWMFSASFQTTRELFTFPPSLIPETFMLDNYRRLLSDWPFMIWYRNSFITASVTTVAVLFFSSLAGFGFAKYRFRGQNVLFLVLLASMMIPGAILLIPQFMLIANLGWVNSLAAVIVPSMASAFGIFFMRQFISYVPSELIDAARIDGASDFRIYWQVILPLVKPGLATLGLLTFLGNWNSFLWPLVVLRDGNFMTLPVGMAQMLIFGTPGAPPPFGPAMAATTLAAIPIIVLFLALQRSYIAGLTLGGVKQ